MLRPLQITTRRQRQTADYPLNYQRNTMRWGFTGCDLDQAPNTTKETAFCCLFRRQRWK
jgi:hypothetical protein